MVSMSVNVKTKVRKTQKMSFSVMFSFLLRSEPRMGEMRPYAPNSPANLLKNKIRPRHTPVRLKVKHAQRASD